MLDPDISTNYVGELYDSFTTILCPEHAQFKGARELFEIYILYLYTIFLRFGIRRFLGLLITDMKLDLENFQYTKF